MGFERDLVYREYILETEYLSSLNPLIITLFWVVCFAFTCRQIYAKFSLQNLFHLSIYLLLSIGSFLYAFDKWESTMLFVIVSLFGLLRVIIDIQTSFYVTYRNSIL